MSDMTSMERVMTALGHQEPDRVPVLLAVTMHGAKELGLSLESYFSRAENTVEGQLRLRRKYGHDCLLGFFYGAIEHEAFGGDVLYCDDGPPNAGAPILRSPDDVFALEVPDIDSHPRLQEVLRAIQLLVEAAEGNVPVLGVTIAPTSLPIMLMGFERYLVLLHEDPEAGRRLLEVTRAFCIQWSQAQFAAGATSVTYFDPVASPTICDDTLFEYFVEPTARRTIPELGGPAGIHLASGRVGDRLDRLIATGAAMVGVSSLEDIGEIKRQAAGRIALAGNLNGVSMASWTLEEAAETATSIIEAAGPGGGFALADNHGEIPFQVSEDVLHGVMEAARTAGRYPIEAAR